MRSMVEGLLRGRPHEAGKVDKGSESSGNGGWKNAGRTFAKLTKLMKLMAAIHRGACHASLVCSSRADASARRTWGA